MEITDSLRKKLDFRVALDRIIYDMRTDFIINPLERKIIENRKSDFLNIIKEEFSQREYTPGSLISIDVPKRDYTLRPGSVCKFYDRVLFQALTDKAAHLIEKRISEISNRNVFSYRLSKIPKDPKMFLRLGDQYTKFVDAQRRLGGLKKYPYVVTTDIAAYFERIYHHKLENTLISVGCDSEIVNAIKLLLQHWSSGVSYGIPQGMFPSDLLGNIYLTEIDEELVNNDYVFVRFVDDYCIFAKNEIEAIKIINLLVRSLRSKGLNLQSAKTKILTQEGFLEKIEPNLNAKTATKIITQKKWIQTIYDEVQVEIKKKVTVPMTTKVQKEIIKSIFQKAKRSPKENDRLIQKCLLVLGEHQDSVAVEFCLENFIKLPYLTSHIVSYLLTIPFEEKILSSIQTFLLSDNNIFDWQEMWLLQYYFTAPNLNSRYLVYLRNLVANRNKHVSIRSTAVRLLGKFGTTKDLRDLAANITNEEDFYIKTGIISAMQRLPKIERNHQYSYIKRANPLLAIVTDYFKQQ